MLRGEHFTRDLPLKNESMSWAWTRYFHNNNENFYIPKSFVFMNKEILVAALNGKLIDTSEDHISRIEKWDLASLKTNKEN